MDKVFFKIIIPNYNNIAYLPKCLDSILNQTFQNFKIVLVDDQSTDFSYEFAKAYERKYPDKLVVLRPNCKKYAGGCRNIGLDYDITCDYVMFIDSDDFLYSNDSLTILEKRLTITKPEILLFQWVKYENEKYIKINAENYQNYTSRLANCYWNASWSKCIKSSFLNNNYFLENCMYGEDTYLWLKLFDKCVKIDQIYDYIYVYRQNFNSVVHQTGGIHDKTKPLFLNAIERFQNQAEKKEVRQSILYRLNIETNNKYFFHIIMPNYNCEKFIQRAINSVLNQTFKDWCLTIIDDMSSDASIELLKSITDKNIEIFTSEQKKYGGGARNRGIVETLFQSKYTLFLDSDDYFESNDCLNAIYSKLKQSNFQTDFLKLGFISDDHFLKKKTFYTYSLKTVQFFETAWSVCTKTDTLQLFQENRYRFNDVVWYFKTLDSANYIDVLSKAIVHYNINENKNSVQHGEKNQKWVESLILLVNDLRQIKFKTKKCEIASKNVINRRLEEYYNIIDKK